MTEWAQQMAREMALQDAYETVQLVDAIRDERAVQSEAQREAGQMTRARRLARLRAAHTPLVPTSEEVPF